MKLEPHQEIRIGLRVQGAVLVVLALLAMGPVLGNSWVQDEGPLIVENARIQQWSGLWTGFTGPWWPSVVFGGLYRPLAQSTLTFLWGASDGAVWAFKLANLLCYIVAVTGVWALARRLLPPTPAWVVAAIFAVHPVHTEVVAVSVNQGESLVAGLFCFGLAAWIDHTAVRRPPWAIISGLALVYLTGLGFKEHALIFPALFLLLVGLRWREGGSAAPWSTVVRATVVLTLVGAAFWGLRGSILGDLTGAPVAFGLSDRFSERSLTMLGVVPDWARLLFWPADLQGDYAPFEVVPWAGWTTAQSIGALLLVGWGCLLVWTYSRRPVAAFALAWLPIALAPVSNLVVPTGVILAERTLMLASVGATFLVVALLPSWIWTVPRWRTAAFAGLGVVLLLGVARSASRMPDWRNQASHFDALGRDAPESVLTQLTLGIVELEAGHRLEGEARLRGIIRVAPRGPRAHRILARYYRRDGLCAPAIPLMVRTIEIEPVDQPTRLSLVACLLDQGRYVEARRRAVEGIAWPGSEIRPAFRAAVITADSAARARAPAGSVRLAPYPGGHTSIGVWAAAQTPPAPR